MPTLFLDLDNTLIYSHRHEIRVPKRVAEMLNGREQSYITEQTFSYLSACRSLAVVPVTTRTHRQYQRLAPLLNQLHCESALICNGAVLLRGNTLDQVWLEETLQLAGEELREVEKAERWLRERCGEAAVHAECGVLAYVRSDCPEQLAGALARQIDAGKADVLYDGHKVYCVPKCNNKGMAVKRFVQRFGVDTSIAAGDSVFDVPMLEQADAAILPPRLSAMVKNKGKAVVEGKEIFSDEICAKLDEMLLKTEES